MASIIPTLLDEGLEVVGGLSALTFVYNALKSYTTKMKSAEVRSMDY